MGGGSKKAAAAKMGAKGGKSAGKRMAAKITSSEDRDTTTPQPAPQPITAPSTPSPKAAASPLLRKTGLVRIDAALQNVSKSIGRVKGNFQTSKEYDKELDDKKKQARVSRTRQKQERRLEVPAIITGILSGVGRATAPVMDRIKNFFLQILIGSIVLFLKRNFEQIKEKLEEFAEDFKEAFDYVNEKFIQPIWNMAKAIVGPVVDIVAKFVNIPNFEGEENKISKQINEILLQVPIFGDEVRKIQKSLNDLKQKIPKDDLKEAEKEAREQQQSLPPSARPPSTRPAGGGQQTTTTSSTPPAERTTQQTRPSTGSGGAPSGDYETKLAKVLGNYEGLRLEAYPDANYGWEIPTIGIGATKYPPGFRLQGKVKKGDVITEEEAYMIKAHDIKEHRQRLLNEIPVEVYNKLPDGVKAALESKVFNYGSLGGTLAKLVTQASKTGNYEPVANYFRNVLAKHNNGINSWRRNDEADMIMSGRSKRVGVDFGTQAQVRPPATRPVVGQQPRVSSDAVVQYITGDRSYKGGFGQDSFVDTAGHGGGNYHEHISFKDRATAVAAYKFLTSKGITVTEFEGYGRVGKHSPRGGHFGPVGGDPTYNDDTDGVAFDIPLYPNIVAKGPQDNRAGEEAFSKKIRTLLREFMSSGNEPDAGLSRSASYEKPAPTVVVAPNTGSGRDGSFGSGTSGKGMPSNPPTQGSVNNSWWSKLSNIRLF